MKKASDYNDYTTQMQRNQIVMCKEGIFQGFTQSELRKFLDDIKKQSIENEKTK